MYKRDGTPIQSSVTKNSQHYSSESMFGPKLGVILEIRYADNPFNKSAIEASDFRGHLAEATVLLVDDSTTLENVSITPDSPTGLDNFEEILPRPCSKTVTGQMVDSNLSQIDTRDLDGDWCIVQFINGSKERAYISRYWPNPRNVYDCATSGKGNPVFTTGKGRALDQRGRYFRRTNGVEYVVTKEGNIWISTARSGSLLNFTGSSSDGRFPRLNKDDGGSILINIKPSQVFELSFNSQVDGIGSDSLPDDSLPQRNPALPRPVASADIQTKVKADKDSIRIDTPVSVKVRGKVEIMMDAPTIKLGESATIPTLLSTPTVSELNTIISKINALISDYVLHEHPVAGSVAGAQTPPPTITALSPVVAANVQTKKVLVE